MKRIHYFFTIVACLLFISACEKDNYEAPDAEIKGRILDQNGKPLQTEQGASNMRIKMEELSWQHGGENISITPSYLNVKQDGSFINSKIFQGEYKMTPVEGPFFPYDEGGDTLTINGSITKDFTVIPYLNVEWVTEPYLDGSNQVKAAIRFTRNSKVGVAQPNLNNAIFCIATTQYVGNNNYDSQLISGTLVITNGQEGQTINLSTSRAVKYTNTTYYVRVGVCCSDPYKKYNYTDIKTVVVP